MDPLDLLRRCGLTNAAAAAQLGCAHQTVSKYRLGRWPIPAKVAARILATLTINDAPDPRVTARDLLSRCAADHASLAADLGCTRQAVEAWRSGEKPVSRQAAATIIALLGAEPTAPPCPVCGDGWAHKVNSLGCLRAEKARKG